MVIPSAVPALTQRQWADVRALWDYHQLGQDESPCDAAIALGGIDRGVADHAATLYARGLFPVVVFSGAVTPATQGRFPTGEGRAFRERAVAAGLPPAAALVEPDATNTGQNITLSREVLARAGIRPSTLMVICMPYMQRRAYATCARQWPEVSVICTSQPVELDQYLATADSVHEVVCDLVGDLQRIWRHPEQGFAIKQVVDQDVVQAYERLVADGFDTRILR